MGDYSAVNAVTDQTVCLLIRKPVQIRNKYALEKAWRPRLS